MRASSALYLPVLPVSHRTIMGVWVGHILLLICIVRTLHVLKRTLNSPKG